MLGWAKLKNQDGKDVSFHKSPLLLFKQLWDSLRKVVSSYPWTENTQSCIRSGTTMMGPADKEQAHFSYLSKIHLYLLTFLMLSAWRTLFWWNLSHFFAAAIILWQTGSNVLFSLAVELTYLMNLQLEAFNTKIPLNFVLCPTSGLLLGSNISDK